MGAKRFLTWVRDGEVVSSLEVFAHLLDKLGIWRRKRKKEARFEDVPVIRARIGAAGSAWQAMSFCARVARSVTDLPLALSLAHARAPRDDPRRVVRVSVTRVRMSGSGTVRVARFASVPPDVP